MCAAIALSMRAWRLMTSLAGTRDPTGFIIWPATLAVLVMACCAGCAAFRMRSEEHTSELQSHLNLVCRLLLEKKKRENLMLHETDIHLTMRLDPRLDFSI